MRDKITKLILVIIIFIAVISAIFLVIKYQTEIFLKNIQRNLTEEIGHPVFVEKVSFKWVGLDVEINIDNFMIIDKGADVPMFMFGNLHGVLSPLGSILRLNLRFKDLKVTSPKFKLAVNSYKDIHLQGLLGESLSGSIDSSPLLKLIFGQQLINVVNANIVISGYEDDILLNYSNIQIIEHDHKSVFKMLGTINDLQQSHYVITGDYTAKGNISFNAQFNKLSLELLGSFFPKDIPSLSGNIMIATISGQINQQQLESLNLMVKIDKILLSEKYIFSDGDLQLIYRGDLNSGRFVLNDLNIAYINLPKNSLKISEMSADLSITNNQITSSNMVAKINDFNGLIKFEISKNIADSLDFACLADFDSLEVNYLKTWLHSDYIPESVASWIDFSVNGGLITHFYAQFDQDNKILQADFGGVALKYAQNWPQINNLNTTLTYNNQTLLLENSSGQMLELPIFVSKAYFSDIGATKFSRLTIDGMSEATVQNVVNYLVQTPLKDQVIDKAAAFKPSGEVTLNLNLDISFTDEQPEILMSGVLQLFNGSLNVPKLATSVDNILGSFNFDSFGVHSQDLSFTVLDNKINAMLAFDKNVSDVILLDLDGEVEVEKISKLFNYDLEDKITGQAYIQAQLASVYEDEILASTLIVKSNLLGIDSTYPEPFNKTATEELPLTLTYKFSAKNIGNVATSLRGYDFAYDFDDRKLDFSHQAFKGSVTSYEKINKYKIVFDYVDCDLLLAQNTSKDNLNLGSFKNMAKPIILEADFKKIIYNKYAIKNFSFQLLPRSYGYQIVDLSINNKDLHLQVQGQWQTKGTEFTQLSGNVYSENFGNILETLNPNSSISKCNGEINFSLESPGDILQVKKNNLEGIVKITFGDGVINGVKPGFGKILGLLSLEGIQRRLQFDFSDLTTQGLAFDLLTADYEINKNIIKTKNLNIQAPAAQIALAGDINIDTREVDLSMLVVPRVGAGIPVAAAIATGNPAIGAAIWLFDKAAGLQIMDFAEFEYHITGTFDKPIMQDVNRDKPRTK